MPARNLVRVIDLTDGKKKYDVRNIEEAHKKTNELLREKKLDCVTKYAVRMSSLRGDKLQDSIVVKRIDPKESTRRAMSSAPVSQKRRLKIKSRKKQEKAAEMEAASAKAKALAAMGDLVDVDEKKMEEEEKKQSLVGEENTKSAEQVQAELEADVVAPRPPAENSKVAPMKTEQDQEQAERVLIGVPSKAEIQAAVQQQIPNPPSKQEIQEQISNYAGIFRELGNIAKDLETSNGKLNNDLLEITDVDLTPEQRKELLEIAEVNLSQAKQLRDFAQEKQNEIGLLLQSYRKLVSEKDVDDQGILNEQEIENMADIVNEEVKKAITTHAEVRNRIEEELQKDSELATAENAQKQAEKEAKVEAQFRAEERIREASRLAPERRDELDALLENIDNIGEPAVKQEENKQAGAAEEDDQTGAAEQAGDAAVKQEEDEQTGAAEQAGDAAVEQEEKIEEGEEDKPKDYESLSVRIGNEESIPLKQAVQNAILRVKNEKLVDPDYLAMTNEIRNVLVELEQYKTGDATRSLQANLNSLYQLLGEEGEVIVSGAGMLGAGLLNTPGSLSGEPRIMTSGPSLETEKLLLTYMRPQKRRNHYGSAMLTKKPRFSRVAQYSDFRRDTSELMQVPPPAQTLLVPPRRRVSSVSRRVVADPITQARPVRIEPTTGMPYYERTPAEKLSRVLARAMNEEVKVDEE